MSKTINRNRTTWAAYILIALYGYFINILGPISPFLHDELKISYTVSSFHSSAFAVGILVVGFAGHWVIRAAGRWLSLSIGATGLGLGALLLVIGRSPVITVGAAFLMGTVGSLILAVVPSALSEEHGELRGMAISEANVLASLVSAAAPFLVGWFAGMAAGWRLALILAAVLSLFVGAILFRRGRAKQITGQPAPAGGRLPGLYWFYWTALVLAVSVEFCMVLWSADYMERVLGMPKARAAQTVSLFLAGMIVGRFSGSRLLRWMSARRLVLASILLGISGFVLFWTGGSALAGMAGLAVTGLGVASLYPVILSIAIGAAGEKEAQASARATLASGTAVLLLPLVLGRLADLAGLKTAYGLVAVLFAALLGMFLLAEKARTAREAAPPAVP